jgi:hypothetical protein
VQQFSAARRILPGIKLSNIPEARRNTIDLKRSCDLILTRFYIESQKISLFSILTQRSQVVLFLGLKVFLEGNYTESLKRMMIFMVNTLELFHENIKYYFISFNNVHMAVRKAHEPGSCL